MSKVYEKTKDQGAALAREIRIEAKRRLDAYWNGFVEESEGAEVDAELATIDADECDFDAEVAAIRVLWERLKDRLGRLAAKASTGPIAAARLAPARRRLAERVAVLEARLGIADIDEDEDDTDDQVDDVDVDATEVEQEQVTPALEAKPAAKRAPVKRTTSKRAAKKATRKKSR